MDSRPVFGQRDALPAAAGLTPLPAGLMLSEDAAPALFNQVAVLSNTLFGFKGRLSRLPFCAAYVGAVALWWTVAIAALLSHPSSSLRFVYAASNFTLLWVFIALSAKRWHDRGRSGAWTLLALVPVVGWVWSFIELGLLEGDIRDNRFGPSPRQD